MNEYELFAETASDNGFAYGGATSKSEIIGLAKALSLDNTIGSTDQVGFDATRMESLDSIVRILTAKEESPAFYRAVRKGKARSTVEEYVTLNDLGSAAFYGLGSLPEEYDEDISRGVEYVKYIGAVGRIAMPATMVESITSNEALITRAKVIAIMRECDTKLFYGDSTKNSLEWDGYYTQFKRKVRDINQSTIDLRGKRLRPETFNDVGRRISDIGNYGNPKNLKVWLSNQAWADYTDELIQNRRYVVGSSEATQLIASARSFKLGDGEGNIETDIFLKFKGQAYLDRKHPKMNKTLTAFAPMHSKAPIKLTSDVCSVSVDTLTGSLLPANNYDYAVVPRNRFGGGAAFEITNVVVGEGKKVTFTISDSGSPSGQEAISFDIYRKLSSSTLKTDYEYLTTWALADTKVDNGEWVPGTSNGFAFDWDFDQVIDFRQLLPMVKMPLAQIDDSKRWLQKLYAVPMLLNANKMIFLKNIGNQAWS